MQDIEEIRFTTKNYRYNRQEYQAIIESAIKKIENRTPDYIIADGKTFSACPYCHGKGLVLMHTNKPTDCTNCEGSGINYKD